jgi:ribosomal protein S18 acetylase RimI-like enzyme
MDAPAAPQRWMLRLRLVPMPAHLQEPPDPGARAPTPTDQAALAELMLAAYQGTVDDEGETPEQALAVMAQWAEGDFGQPMWAVSEVVERQGQPVAATLVTLWQDLPLVAFVMTHPRWQRQGLARAGLRRAMQRLSAGDETVLRLVVTASNAPAMALYEQLGFEPERQLPGRG